MDALLNRVLDATNSAVIHKYEDRIGTLERQKVVLCEQIADQAEPRQSFEEKLEPVLTFLANPWKLWESGNINLRRAVLKLAFAERIQYCRIQGT